MEAPSAGDPRPYIVSEWEEKYYKGVTSGYRYVPLLYRSNYDTDPWPPPQPPTLGSFGHLPSKHVVDIYGTSLAPVWLTVGPLILEIVRRRELHGVDRSCSVDPARFVNYNIDDDVQTLSKPVVWICVPFNSTTPETAHEVTKSIIALLAQHGAHDAIVEWREGKLYHLSGPPLMPTTPIGNGTTKVRRDFTAALNVPLAAQELEEDDAQGSMTLYFHEVKDKDGKPSDKVFAVSNCHALRKDTTVDYTFKDPDVPKLLVRVMSQRRFSENLSRIEEAIASHADEVAMFAARVERMEKAASPDELVLQRCREKLATQRIQIQQLNNFKATVEREWADVENRNIGHLRCAKAVQVDVYTEDWCAIELEEAKVKDSFEGTVIDLGACNSSAAFTLKAEDSLASSIQEYRYRYNECQLLEHARKTNAIENCKLKIRDIVPGDFLDNYDAQGDDACLIVGKDGTGSGLTFGRYAGRVSFVCDKLGTPSTELGIYNNRLRRGSVVFARKDDSGALVWDGNGRAVGQLHSGWGGPSTDCHIYYATPAWWLLERIRKEFPHAEFFRNTWSL
ncbi:hypothetical protein NMY22_g6468 [Coprinellus aureogranulatus]|nr:hypothetical protein NMY22_g6468 [Coprinellus aureogranulatus]